MKKVILIACIFFAGLSFSQLSISSKRVMAPADSNTYKVVQNEQNIDVYNNIELREKINFYRKKDMDFILDDGSGLVILIYKEEE